MMRRSYTNLLPKVMAVVLCSAGLCFVGANLVSALTYQTSEDISFTFNPSIAISLSSDLVINNLTPGSSADSNVITVSTSTNNITGYVLTASVGNTTNTTTNLVNGNYNFASVATNADLANLATDNTWGYSFSEDDGSTWTNYSGLPLYTSANWKEIITTNTKGITNLKFKIGAKASTSQASGTYTNVINFTAVANAVPDSVCNPSGSTIGTGNNTDIVCMQDISSSNKSSVLSSMTANTQYRLIDYRDNNYYYVAKMADGNIWMTQNLDLSLNSGRTYTSADTDLPDGITWSPLRSTYGTDSSTWCQGCITEGSFIVNNTPESYDAGNKYWDGTTFNTANSFNDGWGTEGDAHYHVGNYYNAAATFATNDFSTFDSEDLVIGQSICPKNWTIPAGSEPFTNPNSFGNLLYRTGVESSSDLEDYYEPIFGPKLYSSHLCMPPVGEVYDNNGSMEIDYINTMAYYYTNVSLGDGDVYDHGYYQSAPYVQLDVHSGDGVSGTIGLPIRCVTK